jgi:hypothetical protein
MFFLLLLPPVLKCIFSQDCEWARDHPAQADLSHTLPWGFFGDDVGIFKADKIMVLLASSILAVGSAVDTRFLLFLLPYMWHTETSLAELYRVVAWGFIWLLEGKWATHDHLNNPITLEHGARRFEMRGQPLAGPWKGAFVRSGGDWKYNVETYNLKSYAMNRCCHKCNAEKSEGALCFCDFRDASGWRATVKDHATFMAEQLQAGTHANPLFDIPGWRFEFVWTDIMHCIFQGFGQRVAGSVIVQLLLEGGWGYTAGQAPNIALRRAWHDFKFWCSTQKVVASQTTFTRSRLSWNSRSEYPDMKGKAWNCRCVLAWLADLTYARDRSLETNAAAPRRAVCWGLADICHLMDTAGGHLSQSQVQRFQRGGRVALQAYNWLANDALSREVCLYAMKPKMHQFDHLIDEIADDKLNPALFWNFADESLLGDLKKIVAKCHRRTLVQRTMQKYMLRVRLRWMRVRRRASNPNEEADAVTCFCCLKPFQILIGYCKICKRLAHADCLGFANVCSQCKAKCRSVRKRPVEL